MFCKRVKPRERQGGITACFGLEEEPGHDSRAKWQISTNREIIPKFSWPRCAGYGDLNGTQVLFLKSPWRRVLLGEPGV